MGDLRRVGIRIHNGPVAVTGDDDHVDVVELRHEVDELLGCGEERLAEQAVVVDLLTLDAVRRRIGSGDRRRQRGEEQRDDNEGSQERAHKRDE